jgi:predicted nucleic acid-binding protein
MLYVSDTHALIWYTTGRLPKSTDMVFRSAEIGQSTIFIPTIVLAECLYLIENKKIGMDFDDLLGRIDISRNFIPASFNFHVMKLLPEIKLKELHDRIIIATAKMLNAKLITKDRIIRESGIVETVW